MTAAMSFRELLAHFDAQGLFGKFKPTVESTEETGPADRGVT